MSRHAMLRLWKAGALAIACGLALACSWGRAMAADAARSADDLLRLAPEDASLVVTVEGLRDQVRRIGDSRLIADLGRLPAVRSWLDSEICGNLRRSGAEVEAALGVKLPEIRDQILGDALVLVLRLPPGDSPDPTQARGMLLLRARDPALLERLISAVNAAQRESGELKRVGERRRASTSYHVREFPDGSGRPPEWYVSYPDGTFAFSNSEPMIQGVVDRYQDRRSGIPHSFEELKARRAAIGSALAASPRWIAVDRRLPEGSLARLYLDPRALERLLGLATPSSKPSDARFLAMLRRHLSTVEYAGAAVVWRSDAIVVHAVETLEPSRVEAWVRRWAADPRTCRPELRRVPRTALAMICAHLDLTALREMAHEVVPPSDRPRLRNFEILLTGLLKGHDVLLMLPAIGPGVVAYLEAPQEPGPEGAGQSAPDGSFPMVLVVDLGADYGTTNPHPFRAGPPFDVVADAIKNALDTMLAVIAMDEKRDGGRGTLASVPASNTQVMTLSIPIRFAYAIDRMGTRLVSGTSVTAVSRYLECKSDPGAGAAFRRWQEIGFPGFETFVCVDLDALTRLGARFRDRVARKLASRQNRPATEVEGDLDHLLSLARLFRAAFVASRIETDATALHRCFGVILKDSPGQPRGGP